MSDETELAPPEEFEAAVTEAVDRFVTRFIKNVERVHGLVALYGSLKEPEVPDKVRTDILRSAVVFMHAALEELLRELAIVFLPYGDEEFLNSVPLTGSSAGARPEKFFLGRLARFRGMSIEDVLQQSVKDHLTSSNYNDVGEIERLLCSLKLDSSKVRDVYPALAEMMSRRHQIVHRADVAGGTTDGEAAGLAPAEVLKWIEALMEFAREVSAKAVMRHLIQRRILEVVDGKMRLLVGTEK